MAPCARTSVLDSILKQAWQSIDDMITHTNRLYVKSAALTSSTSLAAGGLAKVGVDFFSTFSPMAILTAVRDPLFNCSPTYQQFTNALWRR